MKPITDYTYFKRCPYCEEFKRWDAFRYDRRGMFTGTKSLKCKACDPVLEARGELDILMQQAFYLDDVLTSTGGPAAKAYKALLALYTPEDPHAYDLPPEVWQQVIDGQLEILQQHLKPGRFKIATEPPEEQDFNDWLNS